MITRRFITRHGLKRKVLVAIFLISILALINQKSELKRLLASDCASDEPIDVVYTWVNGSDQRFIEHLHEYIQKNAIKTGEHSKQRFEDRHELKFSLRSLEKYAPWVRHVFIVTNGQIPYWLNLDYDKVSLVSHDEIFADSNDLPTFSSPAIESHLHKIPGLSRRFIYLNDDIFFGDHVHIDDFVSPGRGYLIYLAYPMPMCAPDCSWLYVSDGQCDNVCLNFQCQMDGGDCVDELNKTKSNQTEKSVALKLEYNLQSTVRKLRSNETIDFITDHNRRIMKMDKINRRKRVLDYNSTLLDAIRRSDLNIDAYAASLQHTNRRFNEKYKFTPRQVPAHCPILIDRLAMEKLQAKFSSEFEKTSRNRLRSSDDMQYAFSYYYFLIHERKSRKIEEIFDMFDTDSSRTWSDREIRTILTRLYELPLSYSTVDHFELILRNCSMDVENILVTTPEFERYTDSRLPTITKELVSKCKFLADILNEQFGLVPTYKYEKIKNSHNKHVMFIMLNSNVSDVVGHLDEIRRKTRKFVCLNDNLDERKSSENELIKAILYDFYLSLFPKPSRFELPVEFKNRFLYLDDLRAWKSYRFKINMFIYVLYIVLIQIGLFYLCRRRCLWRLVNKIFCWPF